LNIEAGRLGTAGGGTRCSNRDENGKCRGHKNAGRSTSGETFHGPDTTGGRWPANLVLQHTPECKQVGVKKVKGGTPKDARGKETPGTDSMFGGTGGVGQAGFADDEGFEIVEEWSCHSSCPVQKLNKQTGPMRAGPRPTGGAQRFFFNSNWNAEVQEGIFMTDSVNYCSKAGRKERDAGLDERCTHPTMKPIKLCKWLASLLLPPEQYAPRKLLVPFAGVGSEMIGGVLAGWDQIVGVEYEDEYVWDAEQRLDYWLEQAYPVKTETP